MKKRLPYFLSALALAALTLLFLAFPSVYDALFPAAAAPSLRAIQLEPTQRQLTAGEVVRLLFDNAANGLCSLSESGKTNNEILADCREAIQAVFGPAADSELTRLVLEHLQKESNPAIVIYRFVTLSGDDILSMNVVTARFGDVYVCYEEDTKAVVQILIHNDDGGPLYGVNEFSELMNRSEAPRQYYDALGLKDGEFDSYAYNGSTGVKMSAGLIYATKMPFNAINLLIQR